MNYKTRITFVCGHCQRQTVCVDCDVNNLICPYCNVECYNVVKKIERCESTGRHIGEDSPVVSY